MSEITRHTPVDELPELLRVQEVAVWLSAGTGLVYELVRRGDLPHVRLGRLVRIPRTALATLTRAAVPRVADEGGRRSA